MHSFQPTRGVEESADGVATHEYGRAGGREDSEHPRPQPVRLDEEAEEGEDEARADEGPDEAIELLGTLTDHLSVPAPRRPHEGQCHPDG